MAALLGVCVVCLVLVVFVIARSVAGMVRASTAMQRSFYRTLEKHDDFLVAALNRNVKTMAEAIKDEAVMEKVKQLGLGPFLGQPGSLVRRDIEETAKHLGVGQAEAARYLATSIASR